MATSKQQQQIQPPKGMRKVNLDMDNNPKVDWDATPIVTGKIVKIKTVMAKRKKSPEPVETRFAVIETEAGKVNMWETAALQDFFDELEEGLTVWVRYIGDADLSDNRTMRQFEAYVG